MHAAEHDSSPSSWTRREPSKAGLYGEPVGSKATERLSNVTKFALADPDMQGSAQHLSDNYK